MVRNGLRNFVVVGAVAVLLLAAACAATSTTIPSPKIRSSPTRCCSTQAINEIEHSRYERARLILQTLMNTYDTSEYLAKAKLAVADSWYREGGAHGLAQAEAEYKDFILFYPNMEEAAEAQEKICKMQYSQMDKADRDPIHACAPRTSAGNWCCSSPTASSRRKRSRCCATCRRCWPTRSIGSACSTTTRAASRRPPTACRR